MNKKLIFFSALVGLIFVFYSLQPSVLAVEDDDQEVAEAAEKVTTETVTQSLKDKLEEAATDKLTKAKDILGKKSGLYAYVGLVSGVENNIITIKAKKGEKRAETDDESVIVFFQKGKGEKTIKAEDIETDSYAIAMGEMKDDEIILVKRMMLSEQPTPVPEKKVIFGKIEEIDEKQVKIKNKEELTLDVPKDLVLKIAGVEKPKIADVEVEDKAIVVLQKGEDEDESYNLLAIFVVPGKHSPESAENQLDATESAQVASPSAKEKEE